MNNRANKKNTAPEYSFDPMTIFWGFLFGSIILANISILQKTIAGFDIYEPKGYLFPFIVGGVIGVLINFYINKIKRVSHKLRARVEALETFLPICANCKKIRHSDSDPLDNKSWVPVETYFSKRSSITFSHGICPDCYQRTVGSLEEYYQNMK